MMAYPLECDIAFIDGAMQTPLQSCEPDFGTYLWCSDLLELDTDNSCNVPPPIVPQKANLVVHGPHPDKSCQLNRSMQHHLIS